jgi:hypothetical protein
MGVRNQADDSSIANEWSLWRRIPLYHVIFDDNLRRFRPTSAAFDDDPDGSSTSVVLGELVFAGGRGPNEVLAGHPNFALAAITAGFARSLGLAVVRDPLPFEPAHALLVGDKTKSVKRALAKAATWIVPPPTQPTVPQS